MPKVGMQPIRRRQLINATMVAIHKHGFADATMQRIAREAGLSAPIIHHYFRNKDDLFAATMRQVLTELRDDVVRRLARTPDPRSRVITVLEANFACGQFTPEVISAWLAFWAQSPHQPELARLRRLYTYRTMSNLRAPLRHLLPLADARRVTTTLASLIDGLWLRAGQHDDDFDADDALDLIFAYLDSQIPPPAQTHSAA